MERIRAAVSDETGSFSGQYTDHHAMVSIVETNRHFWSPWMNIDIREQPQSRLVFCRFSPHPSIWTGFMFSYLALAVISFFAMMFGISQQLASQNPWAYFIIPGCAAVAGLLWVAAQAGQKLAHNEMRKMKAVIEGCLTD